jgi:hypothetical protein
MQLGSPSPDWQWWLDRGCCRRAAATCRWWRGRGHSNSGEDRQLHGGLGDGLRWLVYSGDERGAEPVNGCPTAVAGAQAPVSRQLGQANKRAQELLGVLVE